MTTMNFLMKVCFQFFYTYKLSLFRRLILDTSADSEKEENMVEWLREVLAF